MQSISIFGVNKPASRIAIGTAWFEPARKEAAFTILDAYVQAGGNFIDTARIYGDYTSEDILAEWIETHLVDRERLIIQTKGCHHEKNTDTEYPEHKRVSPHHIQKDLAESLKHLRITYADLFLLHRDDQSIPIAPLMDTLEEERKAGRIHAYGVSNWTYARIKEANDYCAAKGYQGISVNSPAFSLAAASSPAFPTTVYLTRSELLQFKSLPMITTVCWSSQAQGFFTRTPEQIKDLTPETQKAYMSPSNQERRRRASLIAEMQKKEDVNATTVALAWVLNQPVPLCAIIGPSSLEHLKTSLAALNMPLTPKQIDWLNLERFSLD